MQLPRVRQEGTKVSEFSRYKRRHSLSDNEIDALLASGVIGAEHADEERYLNPMSGILLAAAVGSVLWVLAAWGVMLFVG
jgi:hypothetical protein